MSSSKPSVGQKIRIDKKNDTIIVPDHPIIPFIEGDGGPDIWRASQIVFDAAVEKA
jgi:isocitrate dehydrogenase